MREPMIRKSFKLPRDHMVTVRATPWTISKTAVALLPWALVVMTPKGRARSTATMIASRFSPLVRQRIR